VLLTVYCVVFGGVNSLRSRPRPGPQRVHTFMIISRSVLLRMRNVSDKSCREIKAHILCSTTFPENLAVYEIMWKNMVDPDRPQMAIYYRACALRA
jgi:hypothetical protein